MANASGNTTVRVPCQTCYGTGKCRNPYCQGGIMKITVHGRQTQTLACPSCAGTGKCVACAGSGRSFTLATKIQT